MEPFSALLAFVRRNHRLPVDFPMTQSFDGSFNLRLNKRLSKQSRRWWLDAIALIMTLL